MWMNTNRKRLFIIIAILLAIMVLAVSESVPNSKRHLQINVTLSGFNTNSQAVCLITMSNTSGAFIIEDATRSFDYRIGLDYLTITHRPVGAFPRPILPHESLHFTFAAPKEWETIRVVQSYECLPRWREVIGAQVNRLAVWRLAFTHCKLTRREEQSNLLDLRPVANDESGPLDPATGYPLSQSGKRP
jgi:hypothetical protein